MIGWYANSLSPAIASIRLRCLLPMARLAAEGVRAEGYSRGRRDAYETVVFSKTYDAAALAEAQWLKARGRRVLLDLCDNHFFGEREIGSVRERSVRLEKMIEAADLVIVSTPTLRDQLIERFSLTAEKLRLIPDYLEEGADGRLSLSGRFALWRLKRFLGGHPGALRLIWFGNHGAGTPAGMADLARIRPMLQAHARAHPVTLTVMSNSRRTYRRVMSGWSLPTTYVAWSVNRMDAVLRLHDVAVLPINPSPFTLAKTVNRPATAVLNGLGVIADAIPSYEELRPFVRLDDWAGGLDYYGALKSQGSIDVAEGQVYLRQSYSDAAITGLWKQAVTA
jgi:hypothetical protein